MPSISNFYGITIYMYNEEGSVHHCPHIHAKVGDEEIVIDFETDNILAGSIAENKKKLLLAWIEIHRVELSNDWIKLQAGKACDKISPLK